MLFANEMAAVDRVRTAPSRKRRLSTMDVDIRGGGRREASRRRRRRRCPTRRERAACPMDNPVPSPEHPCENGKDTTLGRSRVFRPFHALGRVYHPGIPRCGSSFGGSETLERNFFVGSLSGNSGDDVLLIRTWWAMEGMCISRFCGFDFADGPI